MKNVLNYFRIKSPTPYKQACFIVDHYGSSLNKIVSIIDDETYRDLLSLIHMQLGSKDENKLFLDTQYQIFKEIKELVAKNDLQ